MAKQYQYMMFVFTLAIILAGFFALVGQESAAPTTNIIGVVFGDNGPLEGALVRVRATSTYTRTDRQGRFSLVVPQSDAPLYLTAWAPGYYITGSETPYHVNADAIELFLRPYPTSDNPDYQFISPTLDMDNPTACGHCHRDRSGTNPFMPVDEWMRDAHSQSAVNSRFLSLYNGTSITGEQGTLTNYRYDSQLGIEIPLITTSPVNVGFKLDFPQQAGNCATCHVPIAALNAPYSTDPNQAHGVEQEGVSCDFCHKIQDVRLQADGRPYQGMTGILSLDLLRPSGDEQIFIGPFDDVVGDDIYSALQNQSQICAACHSASFWSVPIYDSFGEWLVSPYSDTVQGKTCQDCHMPRIGVTAFVQLPPDDLSYVPQRAPNTVFSHSMSGALSQHLLKNTAELNINVERATNALDVMVQVTNTGAGHHIPTDNPLRNMILVLEVNDAAGQALDLLVGPTIPQWGGVGNPDEGYYAGLPGVLYAKMLADYYTNEIPTFAYWRQTTLYSDNRIPALTTDETHYTFALPEGSTPVSIEARLYLRRAFIALMDAKAWDTEDILMEQVQVILTDD
jgi:hypothetical protein